MVAGAATTAWIIASSSRPRHWSVARSSCVKRKDMAAQLLVQMRSCSRRCLVPTSAACCEESEVAAQAVVSASRTSSGCASDVLLRDERLPNIGTPGALRSSSGSESEQARAVSVVAEERACLRSIPSPTRDLQDLRPGGGGCVSAEGAMHPPPPPPSLSSSDDSATAVLSSARRNQSNAAAYL